MHLPGSFLIGLSRSISQLVLKQRRSVVWRLLGVGLLPLVVMACGGSNGGSKSSASTAVPTKHVIFMAGFKPQANLPFVGVYVAQEKGFFKDAGLDVDIKHAQQGEHLQLLLAGEIQFTTANGAQILSRNDQGLPLVSLALIGQKSEQGFVVGAKPCSLF